MKTEKIARGSARVSARLITQAALVAALVTLSACASGTLPDYNILGALRVLALVADNPEVDPSTNPTVNITPVVSDLNQGRALSFTAMACPDPGVGYGATPSCSGVPGAVTLTGGPIPPSNLDPNHHTNTGAAPSVAVTIPSSLINSTVSAINQYNGVAYLLIYTLIAANPDGSTSQVVSFKRIIASTKTPKNLNPSITGVTVGAQTLQAYITALAFPLAGGTTALMQPVFGAVGAETYTLESGDPSNPTQTNVTETLTTTWFVTDGTTTFYRTNASDTDTWTLPTAQPIASSGGPRSPIVVAVTRDGRGGESFVQVDPTQ